VILVPNVVQLVAVVHGDVTETYQIEHLKNICKTYIHVQSTYDPLMLSLNIEHKRSNGKCITQVIVYGFIFLFYHIYLTIIVYKLFMSRN